MRTLFPQHIFTFPKVLSQSILAAQKYPYFLLLTFLNFENQIFSILSKIFFRAARQSCQTCPLFLNSYDLEPTLFDTSPPDACEAAIYLSTLYPEKNSFSQAGFKISSLFFRPRKNPSAIAEGLSGRGFELYGADSVWGAHHYVAVRYDADQVDARAKAGGAFPHHGCEVSGRVDPVVDCRPGGVLTASG